MLEDKQVRLQEEADVPFDVMFQKQRDFFATGVLLSWRYRRSLLDYFELALNSWEQRLLDALYQDLGKSPAEALATEFCYVKKQLRYMRSKLRIWCREKKYKTLFFLPFSRARVQNAAFGSCLILAPWNYPLQLALVPALTALAAGNTVVIKPSEYAPATGLAIAQMLSEFFTPDVITVVLGGAQTSSQLIAQKPDHIFFTGSTAVGKKVAIQAAEHLIPVVLELGGKNPAIALPDANLLIGSRRLAWAKGINAGQTCVAPDFLCVPRDLVEQWATAIWQSWQTMYSFEPNQKEGLEAPEWTKIVNIAHFDRLTQLLNSGEVLFEGRRNRSTLYFEPVILKVNSFEAPVMQGEVFGPILPIFVYDSLDELVESLATRAAPLVYSIFTRDKKAALNQLRSIKCGAGLVNDALVHLVDATLPFGGIAESGMGRYHGYEGFKAFTWPKTLFVSPSDFDAPWRYPPLKGKEAIIKRWM